MLHLRLRAGALALLAAFLTSGCSEVLSGLNVDESAPDRHAYRVVKSADDQQYQVILAEGRPVYQVIPIGPEVIATIDGGNDQSAQVQSQLKPLLPSDIPPEYMIGPGDVLNITVWDHPELTSPSGNQLGGDPLTQGHLVAADGTMFYPYVGTFKVAGMTVAALRDYLSSHIKSVIQNPQIDARVTAFRANRIQVTGEVLKPGTLTLDDTPKGVLQAIDACSGLTPAASRRRILLVRNNETYHIDLAGLLSGEHMVINPRLEPGDVIHVPDQSGDQVFVLGEVDKQQSLVIPQAYMSLIQALTQTGGLDKLRAKDSGVLVFRLNPDKNSAQPALIYTLNLGRPEGILLASQFPLQPRDVVYVKATDFAKYNTVITQLLPTVQSIFYLNQLTKN